MRTSALTLLAIASLATAQGGVPQCATGCVSGALPAQCNLNPQCICADTSFITNISCCVSTACDLAGQEAAISYARQICAPVGVTNLPASAGCSSGATAATSASGAASAATSASMSMTMSGPMSGSMSMPAATGSASSLASSANTKAPGASPSISQQSTGAAPTVGPMGIAGVVAIGALAFL